MTDHFHSAAVKASVEHLAFRTSICNGRSVDYSVTLEHLPFRQPGADAVGTMSAFSYVGKPLTDGGERPIVFLTNGGPGVSTLYLHLSGIGPFRARVPTDPLIDAEPPFGVETSASTILDVADLVFLDAPGTGFGTIDFDADMAPFHTVEGDAAAIASAISEWVRRHGRWNARRYFLGESYGTQRAAFLATDDHARSTVPLSGLILLGQAVNIQETLDRPGNVVGALANLPYKAATAWFHGVGSREHAAPEEAARAALDAAWGDLGLAMLAGNRLPEQALRAAADRLGAMIGIPSADLVRSRLWISKDDFRVRLLDTHDLGVTDSRYTIGREDAATGELPLDAADLALSPRFSAAFHALYREVFGEPASANYRETCEAASSAWEWEESGGGRFVSMEKPSPFHTYPYPARLTRWMSQAPHGRLFLGTGLYDSLTTVGAADHLVRHWDLPADRVESRWYRAGHMMYSDAEVAAQLNADLRRFLTLHSA